MAIPTIIPNKDSNMVTGCVNIGIGKDQVAYFRMQSERSKEANVVIALDRQIKDLVEITVECSPKSGTLKCTVSAP